MFGQAVQDSVRWRRPAHYGVALIVTAISVAARLFLTPELGLGLPYITLFPAVAFSAWLGGFGPGALSTVLNVVAAAYLWVPSTRFFAGSPTFGDGIGLTLFVAIGLFMSGLAEARMRGLARIERQLDEIRQVQQREQQARSEAERANHAKDEFLAILAHELRQPLAAIFAALAVLRQHVAQHVATERTAAERSIAVVERQTGHLRRLVEDLLDASRIVRGEVVLQRRPLNAVDVVRDAVEAARPRADERRQHLECRLPDAPIVVDADPTRLQQVLLNVLSNAIRYTPPGGDIQLVVERESDRVAIRVRDSGEGIAADELSRIFSLFVRAGERRGSGLGIGLAVARSLTELHGGAIDAASEGLGRGSEFRITLPLA